MNVARTISFLSSPWTVTISIVVIAIAASLGVWAWKRSGFRKEYAILEGIRMTIVILGCLLFNQPEWIEVFRPNEKPTVVVLWDDSKSMDTQDVIGDAGSRKNARARKDVVAELTQSQFWKKLEEKLDVVIQPLSQRQAKEGASISGTNLHDPLEELAKNAKNLRGVVLATDGDWNEGKAPVIAASQLRLKGVPIYSIPVGATTRLPDLELLALDAPTFGVAGKAVRIPFSIESTLPREQLVTMKLTSSDGDEVAKEIRIAAMGRTSEWLIWKPKAVGDYTVTLDLPRQPDELLADNNRLTAPIAIREEKLRVLIVESLPRWEYRYLRNALSRDPGVDVSCLLFHPGLGKIGGGNADYIKKFPQGIEELSKYDVIFLGDVGVEEGQLNDEECRLLKGVVEHHASGLVFLPGFLGKQFSILSTELGDLSPVMLDSGQPEGWGSRSPNHFELTEQGQRSLLTKLAETPEENAAVWEGLPGFQWYAPVIRAKAGAEVLCVHQESSNEFGRLPLLATRTFGSGKVLFMGTDGAWRWRKGVEDKYHYRFWGQVVRWMAYQRNMAKGETMRLYYSPEQPQVKQTISMTANVMDSAGGPLAKGDVSARIIAPSGAVETIRFAAGDDEWGQYSASATLKEAGKHQVTLSCRQTNATLETSLFVQGGVGERPGKAARPDVLEELSRVTQGEVIAMDNLESVIQKLAALPEPPPSIRRVQLWCHPVVASILVGLLGLFWVARKYVGLI
jgi:hypothetical protein